MKHSFSIKGIEKATDFVGGKGDIFTILFMVNKYFLSFNSKLTKS